MKTCRRCRGSGIDPDLKQRYTTGGHNDRSCKQCYGEGVVEDNRTKKVTGGSKTTMLTAEEHLDNLVRHIELVREACLLLGKRLMAQGRKDFGRILISKGFIHDASKFAGIEWKYLHAGNDVPKDDLDLAIQQHVATNPHHPEYWGGVENMPEIYVAEMVCDWYARSMEFGTGLRDWIKNVAIDKFKIDTKSEKYEWINMYVDLLLQNHFVQK